MFQVSWATYSLYLIAFAFRGFFFFFQQSFKNVKILFSLWAVQNQAEWSPVCLPDLEQARDATDSNR